MKRIIIQSIFLFTIMLYGCHSTSPDQKIAVKGVQNPVISLNGSWKFSMNPPANFSDNGVNFQDWDDIQVPGECQMQGFAIKHDIPYVYKLNFRVPEDFNGKKVLINFYGAYSYARVWVNGSFVRGHFGGFTKWSCDITGLVSAGDSAILTVEIIDPMDDISYGSGYAKHQIGGILRDVELTALPEQNFKQLYFETDLDENYLNAELKAFYELNQNTPSKIKIELLDSENRRVKMIEKDVEAPAGNLSVPVENPKKWDAEHPNLYTVITTLFVNGDEVLRTAKKIGFREVEVSGNKLLVNGKQVKLRGACRHDIHPLFGRISTPEYDKKDVLLAKEANMNFIRTSHYPPSETFLDYCDEYGIYVEDETAVCFVGSHRTETYRASGASQNDPEFTGRYLSQLEEMIQNHRNHSSIIIWSIGNENVFGSNFVESFNRVKENDTTRPVIYSYPGQVPDSLKIFDIVSMHYPDWKGNLTQYGLSTNGFGYEEMPVLFDEWAHVACYNNFELKKDPNVRQFWGQSLDSMWTRTFEAEGGLGGAIWGMLDETFMLPDTLSGFNEWWGILDPDIIPATYMGPCVGYGEWGIIDTWRRKKPEFWGTKKAYSPTKIMVKQIDAFVPDQPLRLPVHNRFDHTNFNEIKILWKYDGRSGEIKDFNLEPHQKGELVIPAMAWENGQKLNILFFQNDTSLIDEYNIRTGERKSSLPLCQKGKLTVDDQDDEIRIQGKKFSMQVDKKSGLLKDVEVNGNILIKSGPYINSILSDRSAGRKESVKDYAENRKYTLVKHELEDGIAKIYTEASYAGIKVGFVISVDENGVVVINYSLKDAPEGNRTGELGIKFITGNSFEKLTWDRDAYFTAYPENDLGMPHGEADLGYRPRMEYRKYPDHDWVFDTKGFYYFGLDTVLPLTNIARSLKENIYSYSLKTATNEELTVYSNGKQACRFDKVENDFILYINDLWDYPSLGWGNYTKNSLLKKSYQNHVIFSLHQ